jgi:outer membrane protein assembly factor BamB
VLAGAADFLVVRESASTLNAYDANSGRKRWRVRIVDGFRDIYFGSPSGVLCGVVDTGRGRYWMYGIRRTTGSVSWRSRLPAADVCYGPWGHDDQVYVAMGNRGKWTAVTLDARTGTLGSVLPMAEFDPDGTDHEIRVFGLVFVGSTAIATVYDTRLTLDQAGLTAINGGAVRWHRPLLNPKTAVSNAGRLFAASYDSILQELDPATGKTLWSVSTPGPVNHISVGSAMLMVTIGSRTTAYPLLRR